MAPARKTQLPFRPWLALLSIPYSNTGRARSPNKSTQWTVTSFCSPVKIVRGSTHRRFVTSRNPDAARTSAIEVDGPAAFRIGDRKDGAVRGAAVGTLIHGILANAPVRAALLDLLRARRGLPAQAPAAASDDFDRLAATLRAHLDWPALRALVTG